MRKEDIETILNEKVDWKDVHEKMVFFDAGTKIYIKNIGTLKALGIKNVDEFKYLDEWGYTREKNETYTVDDKGKNLTRIEVILMLIKEGEWEYLYREWKEKIIDQWEKGQKVQIGKEI